MYLLITLLLVASFIATLEAIMFMLLHNTTDIKNTWLGKAVEYIKKWLPKK